MKTFLKAISILGIGLAAAVAPAPANAQNSQDPKATEVWDPVPRIVTPGRGTLPPSDAIVLFSGKDLSEWQRTDGAPAKWKVDDNSFTVVKGGGNIATKRSFGDCQLHIEWRTPRKVGHRPSDRKMIGTFRVARGRANSDHPVRPRRCMRARSPAATPDVRAGNPHSPRRR